VLPRGPAQYGLCRYNGTRDTTSLISTDERCFVLGPLLGYITQNREAACGDVGPGSEELLLLEDVTKQFSEDRDWEH
jgi:hypothetical protein